MTNAPTNDDASAKKPIRWMLLVLLWAWALVMFIVVDLFLDVEEFDHVRPRTRGYRGMRRAAHEMVGTKYDDPVEAAEIVAGFVAPKQPEPEKKKHRGRILHRYLPRSSSSTSVRHGTYTQWNDPPEKGAGELLKGMRHGTWVWRWPSGDVREERHYDRGILNGKVTSWYEGGQKKAEEEYRLQKPVGTWKTWHPDGTLAAQETYENGVLQGEVRQWHADGTVAGEAVYEHGAPQGKLTTWHANGMIKETGSFAEGKRDGVWMTYGPDGEVVKQVFYTLGKKTH